MGYRIDPLGLISDSDPTLWGEVWTPEIIQGNKDVDRLFGNWTTGRGDAYEEFGPGSPMSNAMRRAAIVRAAVKDYREGNFYQNKRYEFGVLRFCEALSTPSFSDDFVGSANIEIYEMSDGRLRILLHNDTDIASATKIFGLGGKWLIRLLFGVNINEHWLIPDAFERVPGVITPYGTIRQTIIIEDYF